jgi:hypothetical protein
LSDQIKVEKIILSTQEVGENLIHEEANTDVIVHTRDGYRYVATFCTYKKMEILMYSNDFQQRDTYHYLWFKNLVLVKQISEDYVNNVVEEMIDEGDFQVLFQKIN